MPPKSKITKEEILAGALSLIRKQPEKELNARALAEELGISTQPIFTHFSSMETLKKEVVKEAEEVYRKRTSREIASGKWPIYKAYGMGYIAFAREEKALFRLLFMKHTANSPVTDLKELCQGEISQKLAVSSKEAEKIHLAMWIFVHGIATMIATGFLEWTEEEAEKLISDQFSGMRSRGKESQ